MFISSLIHTYIYTKNPKRNETDINQSEYKFMGTATLKWQWVCNASWVCQESLNIEILGVWRQKKLLQIASHRIWLADRDSLAEIFLNRDGFVRYITQYKICCTSVGHGHVSCYRNRLLDFWMTWCFWNDQCVSVNLIQLSTSWLPPVFS